jgi:hypothetical protein
MTSEITIMSLCQKFILESLVGRWTTYANIANRYSDDSRDAEVCIN